MMTWLFWLQIVSYVITFVGSGVILKEVAPGPTYWPAMKVQAAMIFGVMAQVLMIYVLAPWFPDLRSDPIQIITRAFFMGGCTAWATVLVVKRNRTPPSIQIDLLGKESPITVQELAVYEEAVQRSIETHGREDHDEGAAYNAARVERHTSIRRDIANEQIARGKL